MLVFFTKLNIYVSKIIDNKKTSHLCEASTLIFCADQGYYVFFISMNKTTILLQSNVNQININV